MDKGKIIIIEQMLQHAETKMMQAEFADAEMKAQIYEEAKDELIRAEKILAGSGAWLMACLHARQNRGGLCVKWLERAHNTSMIPDTETIQAHPHFKQVLDKDWFVKWMKSHS
jgi:hypothetical protein